MGVKELEKLVGGLSTRKDNKTHFVKEWKDG